MSVPPPLTKEQFAFLLPGHTEHLTFRARGRHEYCDHCSRTTPEIASTERGELICENCASRDGVLHSLTEYEAMEPPC